MWEFYGAPRNLLPDPQTCPDATSSSGVSVGLAARGVYRMLKEGNRMSVPPEAMRAMVRPTSMLQPDPQGGSDLARWLPGHVCREGKYCVETSTGTPLSESFDACGFIGASLQGEIFLKSRVCGYRRLGEMRWLNRS